MAQIAQNLTELIGKTPLLALNNFIQHKTLPANLIAKLEYFNPAGSVKDRIGDAMIKAAENKGIINKDTVLIEATSGNTGIALALVAAAKGYRLIIIMPDNMSVERRKLLTALGAEVEITPAVDGMRGALKKAQELAAAIPNSFMAQQFENPANPAVHRETTAAEIWADTDGKIDIFVAGVGSGGTITGVGEFLKAKNPQIQIIAVEPYDSPILSGGQPGPHRLQGLGPNFVPAVFNRAVVDEIFKVKNQEAYSVTRELAKFEGLLVGVSSGAAVFAATEIAQRPGNQGKNIVVLLPDSGERYLSIDLF